MLTGALILMRIKNIFADNENSGGGGKGADDDDVYYAAKYIFPWYQCL